MSAIAGIFHLNEEPINLEHGRSIMKALEKYPANDIQIWHNEKVFLGCHAQWITPESIGEQLPYYDYERQLAITADAIIDNREDLFEKLQVDRSLRKEITDSELILLAYEKWGEESPKFLVGDFAYMIWDGKRQKLFGARDFSGSRTLYFYFNSQKFVACTAIKPLFALQEIQKVLNEQWLAEFLAIPVNFESVDPTSTVYKNIQQIPPSHFISLVNGKLSLKRYSTLSQREKIHLNSNNEYEEAFREVFQEAVTARLRTHHEVGAHLSGGLDSGSVVSFAAKALRKQNKKLHTYSYVPVHDFVDWTHKSRIANEKPFIESTVKFVGNINDNYLSFDERSPYTEINDWLDTLEMPYKFFENTFWLKGIYEQAQQQSIGVLLNGQRGNWTISWGPVLDYYAVLFKRMNWIRLYQELNQYSKNIAVKKSRIMSEVRKKAFPSLYRLIQSKEQFHFPMIINPHFAERTSVFEKLNEHGIDITASNLPSAYEVRNRQFEQLYYWNTTGTYGSKLSLRYSLWDRDPTNDLRVIKFCLSVPEEQYVRNGLDRSLIRRSTKGYLPDKVRLNLRTRGVQGADGVHRMASYWDTFIDEIRQISLDPVVGEFINLQVIKESMFRIKEKPRPEYAFDFDFRILMRSIIVSRFIKNFT
ncbi:lasso peptide isopeptide bond-forming cyclase [Neobacillus sp. PS3-40]|uniref:lasso peptide isopeptide bond-forming cyclase n=1 Tax=Neobacillus sp. PS3-40 TaxID=3070679 RepID=UPI0027DEDD65|nr:lasso peptide isopeptide bond-forming cyclase [Neobacillus sp. PS3-40]WML45838.1 lasso peptide isopeptide bond-forming cyclase [Neobacillus sp. PS3-40]